MRKKRAFFSAMVLSAALLAGCSAQTADERAKSTTSQESQGQAASSETKTESLAETKIKEEETEKEAAEEKNRQEAGLEKLAEIPGMKDEDTKDLFGGGEENWTEDRSFYIGRIYQIVLGEDEATLYTTCDPDNTVSSISVKFHPNGEEQEALTEKWVANLTEFVGQEPEFDGTSSEGGSQNWKWKKDDTFITLYSLGEDLSIGMNPAVGELK